MHQLTVMSLRTPEQARLQYGHSYQEQLQDMQREKFVTVKWHAPCKYVLQSHAGTVVRHGYLQVVRLPGQKSQVRLVVVV